MQGVKYKTQHKKTEEKRWTEEEEKKKLKQFDFRLFALWYSPRIQRIMRKKNVDKTTIHAQDKEKNKSQK